MVKVCYIWGLYYFAINLYYIWGPYTIPDTFARALGLLMGYKQSHVVFQRANKWKICQYKQARSSLSILSKRGEDLIVKQNGQFELLQV